MSRNLFWSFVYQYSQTLKSVGSIVAKVLENLDYFSVVNSAKFLRGGMTKVLCFLPLPVLLLAVFGLEGEIRMLFDLFLNDFL